MRNIMNKVVALLLIALFAVSGAHAKETGHLSNAKCLETIESIVTYSISDTSPKNDFKFPSHVVESHCSVHVALLVDFDAITPVLRRCKLNIFAAEIAKKTLSSRFHRPPIAL